MNFFPAGKREGTQPSDPDAREAQAKSEFDAMRADHTAYPVWDEKTGASAAPEKAWPGEPYFVRFRNIADPKSVEQVDPDDLAKSFGPGVKLKSLTVQMTDEPVTSGIEKRFLWWRNYLNRHFDGTATVSEDMKDKNFAAHMTSGSFSTEYLK